MLTKEFVKAIQSDMEEKGFNVNQRTTKAFVDAFKEVVVSTLEKGDDVRLQGFLNFETKAVEAKTGRSPQTGEAIEIEAHRKCTAKLAKGLRKVAL